MKRITAEEAKKMMTEQEVVILDVREPSEFQQGHIPKAINLPLGQIAKLVHEMIPDKDATYLVYCKSGMRSVSASKQLDRLGYTDINEFGGIMNWPYDIEK